MAYINQNTEDDEDQLLNNGIKGNNGGFLGSGITDSSPVKSANAPTSSGTRFVNLQRYLEQNPSSGVISNLNNKVSSVLSDEGQKYDTATKDARDFLNQEQNDPLHQSKTDHGFSFLSSLANATNNLADNPSGLDNFLNNRSGSAPSSPSWSFGSDSFDKIKNLSNMDTLAPALASDKSRYTSGMSALDQAIYGTNNDIKNSINKIPGTVDDWRNQKNSELSSISSGLDKFKSDEQGAADATKAWLKQYLDEGAAKGQLDYDPTGKTQAKYANIARLLGVPNPVQFKPIPYELTPEGKAKAAEKAQAEKKFNEKADAYDALGTKFPGAKRKVDMIEDAGQNAEREDRVTPRNGWGYGSSSPYEDKGQPIFGSGSNNNGDDWYNSGYGPRPSRPSKFVNLTRYM